MQSQDNLTFRNVSNEARLLALCGSVLMAEELFQVYDPQAYADPKYELRFGMPEWLHRALVAVQDQLVKDPPQPGGLPKVFNFELLLPNPELPFPAPEQLSVYAQRVTDGPADLLVLVGRGDCFLA